MPKEENWCRGDGTYFTADLFKAVFKVGPIPSCENDRKVEVEFCLAFDELVKAVSHFHFDIGVLLLLLYVEVSAIAEIDNICTREDPYAFSYAVPHLHESRPSSGDKSNGGVRV